MENTRGQTNGLITGIVFGVASLIIGVIIAFVIISTLTSSNLLQSSRTTNSVVNETGTINTTAYELDGASTDFVPGSFVISSATNNTAGNGSVISPALYTVSANGLVTNTTAVIFTNAGFTYTNTVKSSEELSASDLSANFSAGVDNVSAKIPTVLLVAAIILILSVLILLVGIWQRMRMGGNSL